VNDAAVEYAGLGALATPGPRSCHRRRALAWAGGASRGDTSAARPLRSMRRCRAGSRATDPRCPGHILRRGQSTRLRQPRW